MKSKRAQAPESMPETAEKPWTPVSLRKDVKAKLDQVSGELGQPISETISDGLDLLSEVRLPRQNHLTMELLRSAEMLEISERRLATSLDRLELCAFAFTAERVAEMERLVGEFQQSDSS
jgi:hypothetical protein